MRPPEALHASTAGRVNNHVLKGIVVGSRKGVGLRHQGLGFRGRGVW